jgi:hypothetical protein
MELQFHCLFSTSLYFLRTVKPVREANHYSELTQSLFGRKQNFEQGLCSYIAQPLNINTVRKGKFKWIICPQVITEFVAVPTPFKGVMCRFLDYSPAKKIYVNIPISSHRLGV